MKFTLKQEEAQQILAGPAIHVMLFGGSRCVSGDTIIDGQDRTIADLSEIGGPVMVRTTRGNILAGAPFRKGSCKLLKFDLESGKSVTVTPDHRFWSGSEWVKAESLTIGSSVGVLSSETGLQESSSEPCLSRLPSGALRLIGILSSLRESCFLYPRRCGLLLRLALDSCRAGRASQSGALGRIRLGLSHFYRAELLHGLDTHKGHHGGLGAIYSRSYPLFCRLPMMGGYPCSRLDVRFGDCDTGRTFEPFLGLFRNCLQSLRLFSQTLSWIKVLDSVFYRFARFFGLSYDTPSVDGYILDNVLRVTQTAEQDYYTLHVPTAEHYFANGVLHHNSGKTFLLVRNLVFRALKAPKSRHAILRFRFNHVKNSIVHDTFPKVMELCFPGVEYKLDKTDWFAQFPNGSQVWFGGLDDKERTEKILGQEYATIYLNECSQIPQSSRETAVTRLAQLVDQDIEGRPAKPLKPRMYYDCNPPTKAHWSYRLFVQKLDLETKQPLANPDDYAHFQMNPESNAENLSAGYLETLKSLSARSRKRFLEGVFGDATPNQLFDTDSIEKWRVINGKVPDMIRIVVAVDPSGSGDIDNADNDAIGIAVVGLGVDGNGYLLEDCTVKASPAVWGKVATDAYDRHAADVVVGEVNYGGAMVQHTIQTARARTPYKAVTASRGKAVRAEPISALYEQGKVRHVGNFPELEDELSAFSTVGYLGESSPNRADAVIWALTELFPGMVNKRKDLKPLKYNSAGIV